jgi:hypothetical protein
VLSTVKVQLTVELVKCTLLLNRLLVLQIYCCVVGVNNVATEQRFLDSRRQQLDFELLIKLTLGFKVTRLKSFK